MTQVPETPIPQGLLRLVHRIASDAMICDMGRGQRAGFIDVLSSLDHWPLDRCIYCGSRSSMWERDHFPVPEQVGGTQTVRACKHCHNMKDRVSDEIALAFLFYGDQPEPVLPIETLRVLMGHAHATRVHMLEMLLNFEQYQPPYRILIARRLRQQLRGMPRCS